MVTCKTHLLLGDGISLERALHEQVHLGAQSTVYGWASQEHAGADVSESASENDGDTDKEQDHQIC